MTPLTMRSTRTPSSSTPRLRSSIVSTAASTSASSQQAERDGARLALVRELRAGELHHHGEAELGRGARRRRCARARHEQPLRHGDPEAGEQLLRRPLVDRDGGRRRMRLRVRVARRRASRQALTEPRAGAQGCDRVGEALERARRLARATPRVPPPAATRAARSRSAAGTPASAAARSRAAIAASTSAA